MKKGMAAAVLVMLAVVVFAFILMVILFIQGQNATKVPADLVACHASAVLAAGAGAQFTSFDPILGTNVIDFYCPARIVDIKGSRLDSLKRSDRDDFEFLAYDSKAKFNLDKELVKQATTCYQKVGFGRSPLFKRDWFEGEDYVFCLVCAVVDFDEKAKELVEGSQSAQKLGFYLNVTNEDKSIYEIAADHLDSALGMVQLNYDTSQKHAIMYKRSNQPIYVDKVAALYNAIIPENNWFGIEEIEREYLTDVEEVVIVPFTDPAELAQECTHLVSVIE